MTVRALAKPKNKNSTTLSPIFGKKPSGKSFYQGSANEGRDLANPLFGHNFGDVRVESSKSFKQSCPLALSGPSHCPFGGACHTCPPQIQTKLKINQLGDVYEQEADSVADQIMRMPEPLVQRKGCLSCNDSDEEEQIQTKPIADLITPLVQRQVEEEEEEEDLLQAKEAKGGTPEVSTDLELSINSLKGGGQALSQDDRQFLEPRFGCCLSRVRVHTDSASGQIARNIKARAFTLQNNIVFAPGKYTPGTFESRQLLAHELTHTIQQAGDAALRKTVMGRWDNAPTECSDVTADQWIERVVVEQEKPQSVTLHWKDGRTESDTCSTGKGQCCVDPATPEGVACSVARSRRSGSNCTPITEARGYPIRNRYRSYNGWEFWSDFVTARGIGLHAYPTLDGTPLSHGCVRLRRNHARRIFCGARRNRTYVQVHGFSRPSCSHAKLVDEWVSDVSYARQPTDGENVTASLRRGIRATRRTLRSAFGQTQYQQFMSGSMSSRQQITAKIPRCSQRALLPTAEEFRLTEPLTPRGTVPVQILTASGFDRFLLPFTRDLRNASSLTSTRRIVQKHGRNLWNAAVSRAQRSQGASTDDRPIYWARLQMVRALRQWQAHYSLTNAQRTALLDMFEMASRGMDTARFRGGKDVKRILISGFDPFGLHQDIGRGNPSGAAILALDGQPITAGGIPAQVQGVIFPVRFTDFNAGFVERFFGPQLSGAAPPDMIMTISQGGGAAFEVERFAARARSSGDFPGNVGQTARGSRLHPVEPSGLAPGPAFLETALESPGTQQPAQAIRQALGRTAPLPQETEFTEIRAGESRPVPGASRPSAGATAVRGSGGGFLSNEIFYRTLLLRRDVGASIPVGHLHTPYLPPPGPTLASRTLFNDRRDFIVREIKRILEATLPHI